MRLDRTIQIDQSGRHMTALRQRRRLRGSPPPAQNRGDVGDTWVQLLRHRADERAIVGCHENPLPQILRMRFSTSPKHRNFRFAVTGDQQTTAAPVSESPHDSSQRENALSID